MASLKKKIYARNSALQIQETHNSVTIFRNFYDANYTEMTLTSYTADWY